MTKEIFDGKFYGAKIIEFKVSYTHRDTNNAYYYRNDSNSLTLSLMKEYRKLAQRERFTQTNIDFKTRQKMSMVTMAREWKSNRLAKARFRCQNSL